MKVPTTLAIAACAGIAAFLMGRLNGTTAEDGGPPAGSTRSSTRVHEASGQLAGGGAARPDRPLTTSGREPVTAEMAAKMTRAERLALVADGALVFNSGNQKAAMLGLIAALEKDEMEAAASSIGGAQNKGNYQSPEIWVALWKQWGKVDPERCFARFKEIPNGKGRSDARNAMEGWLEADPAGALAWAKEPREGMLEAAAAALAISSSANGDLKQMEKILLDLPADGLTAKEGLRDYFDMASLAGTDRTAATVYDQLPAALKPAAWGVAVQRLHYADPKVAAAWVTAHANDPGRNYQAMNQLVNELSQNNPEETAKWAAALPAVTATEREAPEGHPVMRAAAQWVRRDPVAAKAWLETQPAEATWAAAMLQRMNGNAPQE